MGHRYYDPTVGRFIEPDPIVDASQDRDLNRYTYAHGDPVNKNDPSGLMEGYANGDCFTSMDYYADCMQGLTEVPLLYKAAPAVAVASVTGTTNNLNITTIENNGSLAVAAQVEQKQRRLLQGGVLQKTAGGPKDYWVLRRFGDKLIAAMESGRFLPSGTFTFYMAVENVAFEAEAASEAARNALFAAQRAGLSTEAELAILAKNYEAASKTAFSAWQAEASLYSSLSKVERGYADAYKAVRYVTRNPGSIGKAFSEALIWPAGGFDDNGDPQWHDPKQL
jgi:uncharacterized protein RhaS with RHS repeats